MRYSSALLTAAALAALLVVAGCGPKPAPAPAPPANAAAAPSGPAFSEGVTETDEMAPDFTLKDTTGAEVSKDDFSGKVLCLDFWATWCAPCVKKLKEYEPIIAKYQDKGVELVAVSLDSTPEVAAGWAKAENSPFQIAMLDDVFKAAYFPEVSGQIPVPQMRIIDRDGNLRYKFDSKSTVADLELALSTLVAETAGGAEVPVPGSEATVTTDEDAAAAKPKAPAPH